MRVVGLGASFHDLDGKRGYSLVYDGILSARVSCFVRRFCEHGVFFVLAMMVWCMVWYHTMVLLLIRSLNFECLNVKCKNLNYAMITGSRSVVVALTFRRLIAFFRGSFFSLFFFFFGFHTSTARADAVFSSPPADSTAAKAKKESGAQELLARDAL